MRASRTKRPYSHKSSVRRQLPSFGKILITGRLQWTNRHPDYRPSAKAEVSSVNPWVKEQRIPAERVA